MHPITFFDNATAFESTHTVLVGLKVPILSCRVDVRQLDRDISCVESPTAIGPQGGATDVHLTTDSLEK